MELEAVPAQPVAAPAVTPPVPEPPAPAVPASVARAPVALTPATVRALAPHVGNAAIARMLVAREPAASAAPPGGAPAVQAGPPPPLRLPGGVPLSLPAAPGRVVANPMSPAIKTIDRRFGMSIPVGPLQGEIGGTLNGLARYGNGGIAVDWQRPASALTDPLAVKDTLTVKGSLGASGTVAGGLYASIGLGSRLVAGTRVTAKGMLAATGKGNLTADGTLTRDGANGQWAGDVGWELNATGSLTAAATATFEWNLLWLEGHRELFRLESFPLATLTVTLAGRLKPDGSVVTTKRDFTLETGTPPPAKPIARTPAPGGAPAQVAPKRRAAAAPPEDPGAVLARAAAEEAAAPAPAPAPARTPEAIAGPPAGGDTVVSELVPGPEPDGVEP